MFGLLATGFVPKTEDDLVSELEDAFRAAYGESVDLTPGSIFGQLIGIMAERYAELWALTEEVYASQDPDAATDEALDAMGAITGTVRLIAQPSTVLLYLTGTNATAVLSGSEVSAASTGVTFVTLANATLVTAVSWVGSTAYAVGDVVTNSGNVYICSTAGTSAASGGPSGTGVGETDGTAAWDFLGSGTAVTTVNAESQDTGPVVGAARDLTVIETPVSGWNGVINTLDAELGVNKEQDGAYRLRRTQDLGAPGTGPLDAIRSDLLGLDGVTEVKMFQNTSDVTDPDGMPPHSVEALVVGGADQNIFDQLLASVCAGTATHGTETGTAVDSEGNSHTIKFTRLTPISMYVDVTITKITGLYPADGDTQIKEAIETLGNLESIGRDVIVDNIRKYIMTIPGVYSVTSSPFDDAASPVSSVPFTINGREKAAFAVARITVDSTASVSDP